MKFFFSLLRKNGPRRRLNNRALLCEALEVRYAMSAVAFSADSTRISNITVNGKSILGTPVATGGIYLIGSVDGSDNSGKSVVSIGGSGGKMKADPGVPAPPFLLSFTPNGDGRMKFTATLGPMPADFSTMSMPFDFSKALTDNFKFNGTSYRVECSTSNGRRSGSGATFDSMVPACVIPNTGGQKVSVGIVEGAVGWGEVSGPVATVRVNISNSSHYRSMRFHNHFGTDNLELSFGRMKKGGTATVSGEIIVTPKSTTPATLVFQSESNAFAHQIGRRESDGWSVNVSDAANRYMSYGPYTTAVAAGKRTATFRLQLDNVVADNNRLLTIDVYNATTGKVLAKREILRKDFARAFEYMDFSLAFTAAAEQRLEFRTFWHGGSYVKQDNVTVK